MGKNDTKFITLNENGLYKEYDVLATYSCEELKKDYVLLSDGSLDDKGNLKIIVSYFDPEAENVELMPVTDHDELELANQAIECMIKQAE